MQLYTPKQAQEILSISKDTLFGLLRRGELKSVKFGGNRRVSDQHLAEFIAKYEAKGA